MSNNIGANMIRRLRKLAHNLRRATYPKVYRHMAEFDRRLNLPVYDASGRRRIIWHGRDCGVIASPDQSRMKCRGDCFVVCSGPSLARDDLRRLDGYPTFAVNGAVKMFQSCGMRPTFYAATDQDFFDHRLPLIEQALRSDADCFFSLSGLSSIVRRKPEALRRHTIHLAEVVNHQFDRPRCPAGEFERRTHSDPDLLIDARWPTENGAIGFSSNLAKGLFCGRTIGFRAMQIACHLGFRRLFLLGMDLGGAGDAVRFYEDAQSGRPSRLDEDYQRYIRPSFEVLSANLQKLGLTVYNLSPTSRLPNSVIPKTSLDDALAMARTVRAA